MTRPLIVTDEFDFSRGSNAQQVHIVAVFSTVEIFSFCGKRLSPHSYIHTTRTGTEDLENCTDCRARAVAAGIDPFGSP